MTDATLTPDMEAALSYDELYALRVLDEKWRVWWNPLNHGAYELEKRGMAEHKGPVSVLDRRAWVGRMRKFYRLTPEGAAMQKKLKEREVD